MPNYKITIKRLIYCARCHEDHSNLEFAKLHHPIEPPEDYNGDLYTHWAPCPITGEPILLTTGEDLS